MDTTNDQVIETVDNEVAELSQEETLLRILGEDTGEEPEAEDSDESAEPEGDESESEEAEEPAESEEAEEPEDQRKFTIKHNGEEKTVSQQEMIELAQMGFDYRQKTQAHAEEVRSLEAKAKLMDARAEALLYQEQLASELLQDRAKLMSMESTIEQYDKIDWATWMEQDPTEANKHHVQYQKTLREYDNAKGELVRKAQKQYSERAHYFQKIASEKAQEARAKLASEGWTDEVDKEAQKFLVDSGFQAAELALVTTDEQGMPLGINHTLLDPRVLRIVADAMKYRKLQAAKPAIDKKVKTVPKVAKPGASKPAKSANPDLLNKFRRGDDESGIAWLMSRGT